MIFRQRTINTSKTEISMQMSWGTADVKRYLQRFAEALANPLGMDWAMQQPISEIGLTKWLAETVFKEYPEPHRSQLCKWVFVQAIKHDFLKSSSNDKSIYFFSDDLGKRQGRPRKDVY